MEGRPRARSRQSVSVELEPALEELGSCGRYQVATVLLFVVPIMLTAVYDTNYVFTAGDLNYRCLVPECEPPGAGAGGGQPPGEWAAWALLPGERCRRPAPHPAGACRPHPASGHEGRPLTIECTAWVYETNDTIVATFDLGCQDWKRTLVGTIHSAGLFFALLITGLFSDAYGRKLAFILTTTSRAATGLARSFAPNYVCYVVLEFFDALLGSGTYSTVFILALEMVGARRRVVAGNMISSAFACGQVLLAAAAALLPHWRTLTRALYLPSLLFLTYFLCLEESVRWLLYKGHNAEAARIILKAARINRKTVNPEVIHHLTGERKQPDPGDPVRSLQLEQVVEGPPPPAWAQVLGSRILVARIFICGFWWMTTVFTYYGLSINSVALAGNKYLNYALTALVEIPGYALSVLTLDQFGRKYSIMTAFFLCGLTLLVLPIIPKEARLWLTLGGKLFISMVFSSLYIYTVELFPTAVRHSLMAASSMMGRVGNLLAPQTPLLALAWEPLPYLTFGVMAVSSGLLMLLTPETLRMRLPDTVAEAETMLPVRLRQRRPVDIITD